MSTTPTPDRFRVELVTAPGPHSAVVIDTRPTDPTHAFIDGGQMAECVRSEHAYRIGLALNACARMAALAKNCHEGKLLWVGTLVGLPVKVEGESLPSYRTRLVGFLEGTAS